MNLYLLGLTVSNLCALLTAIPALLDISYGLGGGSYFTAFYQVIHTSSLWILPSHGRLTFSGP